MSINNSKAIYIIYIIYYAILWVINIIEEMA